MNIFSPIDMFASHVQHDSNPRGRGIDHSRAKRATHYENTPIQIHCKFYRRKNENIKMKNCDICDIFLTSAQNIDCGYSLEPPRRGGSNEYPQSMF